MANRRENKKTAAYKQQMLFIPAAALLVGIKRAILAAEATSRYFNADAMKNRREAELYAYEFTNAVDSVRAWAGCAEDMNRKAVKLDRHIMLLGHLLRNTAPLINMHTTVAQRCELLNVALAERPALDESDGVLEISITHGLEDSMLRGQPSFMGGPLFRALQLAALYPQASFPVEGVTLDECLDKLAELVADAERKIN